MPTRIYHWKHGWIPLDHVAALSKAHGSHKGAARELAKSHAAGHAHHSVTKPGAHSDGTHVRGLQPVAHDHLPRSARIIAAHDPQTHTFALLQKAYDSESSDLTVSIPEALGEHLHDRGHTIARLLPSEGREGPKIVVETPEGGVKVFRADGTDRLIVDPAPKAAPERKVTPDPKPEWAQEIEMLGAQLPEDRKSIGLREHIESPEALRQRAIDIQVGHAGGTLEELAVKIAGAEKNLKNWRALMTAGDDHPGIYSAKTWPPELKPLAQAAGLGRRQPRNAMPPLRRAINEQDSSLQKMQGRRFILARTLEDLKQHDFAPKTTYHDDLTPEGELGADTVAALDATREAGRILDKEIGRRVDARMTGFDPRLQLNEIQDKIDALLEARHQDYLAHDDGAYDAKAAPLNDLRETRAQLEHRVRSYEKDRAKVYAEEARAALADLRPMGRTASPGITWREAPKDTPSARGNSGMSERRDIPHETLVARMRAAEEVYPSAWLNHARGTTDLMAVDRGYNRLGMLIALSPAYQSGDNVAIHELGHSMEIQVPGLKNLEWALHYQRSSRKAADGRRELSPPEEIHGLPGEMAQRDEWASHYTGKRYGGGYGTGASSQYEIFTTGIESLFAGSPYFNRSLAGDDAEFRQFILGVLSVL